MTKRIFWKTLCVTFLAVLLSACHFIDSFSPEDDEGVRSMGFDRNSLELYVGSMDIINLTVDSSRGQNNEGVNWEYDSSLVMAKCDNYSIVLTGIQEGTATVKAKCGGKSVSCALRVLSADETVRIENPYVYVSSDFVSLEPGTTEKVFASVYGGTSGDKDGFTFTIDKPAIASLYTEGNYCWLTGKSEGIARVTCRHPRSSWGYSFLVSVAASEKTVSYITTTSNIVTINRQTDGKKDFIVDLKNAAYTTYADDFTYSITDENGNDCTDPPISFETHGSNVSVTALKGGNCYIRVSHPAATYDLDILVRVVEDIENAYIEPSLSYVELFGSQSQTVGLSVAGIADSVSVNPDLFEWSFSADAESYVDYKIYGGSESGKGDSIWLTGKKNGAVKITARHPLCQESRTVLVIVKDIAGEASSSKIYITTSQDYVETKVGAEETAISITLNNLSAGEEENLEWKIESSASDGSAKPVIMFESVTGRQASSSRSAISVAFGKAVIKPLNEGTAAITISHPKAAYPTKILVQVFAQDYTSASPLVLSTDRPFLTIKNGETASLSVSLSGISKSAGEERNIVWKCSDSSFIVNSDGENASITARGSGLHKAILTVSHEKASYPLNIVLAGYDDAAELSSLDTIYASKTFYTLMKGETCNLSVQGTKFIVAMNSDGSTYTENGGNPEIDWLVEEGLDSISFTQNGSTAFVEGVRAGTARIRATLRGTDESVFFYVAVKEPGVIEEGKPCYLTTGQNVVTVKKGGTADISVTSVNIDGSVLNQIEWKNCNPELFSVSANGENATLIALEEGSGTIEVSHLLSKNTLVLNVRIGSEFTYKNDDVAYISSDDIVRLKTDSDDSMLSCVLAHTESSLTETEGFGFFSSDKSLFDVFYSSNVNYCLIKPKKAGQGTLRIHHEKAAFDKEVLVIIEKTVAELSEIPYLSTSQNVATVIQGEYVTLSANLNNASGHDGSKWHWMPQDGNISDLVVASGSSALVSGVSPGTTKFSVTHDDCLYPLEIIVICLDSSSVREKPFIHTSTNIATLGLGKSGTITAELVGGENSPSNFVWTVSDSSVALVSGGGSSCYVRGLKAGQTYITVRSQDYPESYSKTVFVRVEETTDEKCYITLSKKVLKMNPAQNGGETVTATLENGDVLDAKDFVWWADDYNIVSLTSVTDTAKIVPTGISGTTYVHVKHPKVLDAVDILVMCSEYSEFAFSSDSKSILEKSISFIPMQVPATSEKAWIEYESSDSDICVATGSDRVCMVAGVSRGSAAVTATLRTAGGVVATAQMAVIIGKAEEAVNTVSCETTIINMETGESKTLEALLSGSGITAVDSYGISWTSSDLNVVSVLQTGEGTSLGKNAYITAHRAGTAVITVSHPKCLYDLSIWVLVPEKEEATITLDQTYVEMNKSDGAVAVTAKLSHAKEGDENSITWTAPKVGGVNIITVSKSKGKTCNIVPRNTGSTTLRAQLPNGNYADCIVTVLSDAEIVLETKTIHVNPGFSETVSYTVTPESASINWVKMMNGSQSMSSPTEFFDFAVNESSRTITVTGKAVGTGLLYGYSATDAGTAKAELNVICEYNYVLEFDDAAGVISMRPDDSGLVTSYGNPHNLAEIPFHVYPKSGMDISVESSTEKLEITSYSFDPATGKGKIFVKALGEETGGYITLIATNPDDKANTPIRRKKYINSKYDSYTITPVFDFKSGSFSAYSGKGTGQGGTLTLGDGESILFYLDVAEPNANLSNIEIKFQSGVGVDANAGRNPSNGGTISETENHIYFSGSGSNLTPETTGTDGKAYYRIGHNYDYTETGYWVNGDAYFGHTISSVHVKWHDYSWYESGSDWTDNYCVIDGRDTKINPYGSRSAGCNNDEFSTYMKRLCVVKDNSFYYYEKSAFRPDNVDSADNYTNAHYSNNLPYWWVQRHDCPSHCPNVRINTTCHPCYIGTTVSKNQNVRGTSTFYLMITYQTIDGGGKTEAIRVDVKKRMCQANTKGLWTSTYDSNGKYCWKFVGQAYTLEPYIVQKSYEANYNSTVTLQLDTNIALRPGNATVSSDKTNVSGRISSDGKLIVTAGSPKYLGTGYYEWTSVDDGDDDYHYEWVEVSKSEYDELDEDSRKTEEKYEGEMSATLTVTYENTDGRNYTSRVTVNVK